MTCSIWKIRNMTGKPTECSDCLVCDMGSPYSFPEAGYGAKIAGQNQKRYTDKNAAIKYLDGRKKAYSHLFTEISRRSRKNMSTILWFTALFYLAIRLKDWNRPKRNMPPPRFRRAVFLHPKPGEAFRPGEALCGKNSGKKRQPLPVRQ